MLISGSSGLQVAVSKDFRFDETVKESQKSDTNTEQPECAAEGEKAVLEDHNTDDAEEKLLVGHKKKRPMTTTVLCRPHPVNKPKVFQINTRNS